MKTMKKAATLFAAIGALGLSSAALADDCSNEIGIVRTVVEFGICLDNLNDHRNGAKTCDRLIQKLDNAETKIAEEKYGDASQKLEDFQVALDSLAFRTKPIISQDEYNEVNTPLQTAKACVASL
jgi:hypothetical protein